METRNTYESFDNFLSTEDEVANLPHPQCCERDPEGEFHSHPHDGSKQLILFPEPVEEKAPTIFTISAIAFDFDFVSSDPSKSRADEIKVLLVKNKKPPRNSNEGKPGGRGLPTGQLESKEDMLQALKRETRDESGCTVKKIVGKLFVVKKTLKIPKKENPEKLPSHLNYDAIPNEIHVFLVEASEAMSRIREVDEIDGSVEPWVPLREVFEMPLAQSKNSASKNPDGIYFSHRQRLYRAIDSMIYGPEELIDGPAVKEWLRPNRQDIFSAMSDLAKDGLLSDFLPPDEENTEEEIPA